MPGPFPTETQSLLLQAALDGGPDGAQALAAWQDAVRLDDIDAGSARLVPLLYKTHDGEADLAARNRMRGLYRRSWSHNQLTLQATVAVVRALEAEGIDSIVFKGLSLASRAYRDMGMRPMTDADVLVRPHDHAEATAIVTDLGWKPKAHRPAPNPSAGKAVDFQNDKGLELDLHWALFSRRVDGEGIEPFWQRAEPAKGFGDRTRFLAPADELLLIFVHGLAWNALPPIRWIADAVILLRATGDRLAWNGIVDEARSRRLVLWLRTGLEVVQRYGAEVPTGITRVLAAEKVSVGEHYRFWAGQQDSGLLRLVSIYLVASRIEGKRPGPVRFLRFLIHDVKFHGLRDFLFRLRRETRRAGRAIWRASLGPGRDLRR